MQMAREEQRTSHSYPAPAPSGVPDQEAVRTTLTGVISFLKKDNDYGRKVVENELEAKKQAESTLNALLIVAAFIAGVQSQVLSGTFDKNDTTLQIVTNGFGFFGLVLDILGACFGTLYVLELRKAIQRAPDLLRLWEERQKEAIEKLTEEVGRVTNGAANRENITAMQSLRRELLRRRLFWVTRRFSSEAWVDMPLRRHVEVLFRGESRFLWLAASILPTLYFTFRPIIMVGLQFSAAYFGHHAGVQNELLEILGTDPLWLIGTGIMCLLVSVLTFAADSQKPVVWFPCVVLSASFTLNMFLSWCIQFVTVKLTRLLGSMRNEDATTREHAIAMKSLEDLLRLSNRKVSAGIVEMGMGFFSGNTFKSLRTAPHSVGAGGRDS